MLGALLGGCCDPGLLAQAQPESSQPEVTPSLQQQIDELRRGQQQILTELEQIKALLRQNSTRSESTAKLSPTNALNLNVQGEPFRGASNAPVAVIEYSDFACSFCGRYAREVYPRLEKTYVTTGKVKYYFRDLPAPEHQGSLALARAARCAGDQGKFWELHDWLFATQGGPESTNVYAQAAAVNVDVDAFQACMTSGKYTDNIRLSVLTARRAGIYGTPAFVLGTVSHNGTVLRATKVLVGSESSEELESALDELVAAVPGKEPEQRSKR
jgi:protein-disulfide isomerase